jgi:hypothetical protein
MCECSSVLLKYVECRISQVCIICLAKMCRMQAVKCYSTARFNRPDMSQQARPSSGRRNSTLNAVQEYRTHYLPCEQTTSYNYSRHERHKGLAPPSSNTPKRLTFLVSDKYNLMIKSQRKDTCDSSTPVLVAAILLKNGYP